MEKQSRGEQTVKNIGMSKGLEHHKGQSNGLINGYPVALVKAVTEPKMNDQLIKIPIGYIKQGTNVRRDILKDTEFDGLVESIEKYGLIQNPTISYQKGNIVLLTGHRRLEACKHLGWKDLVCKIKVIEDENDRLGIQLVENLNRSGLSAIDYIDAVSTLKKQTKSSNIEIGKLIGKSRVFIDNLLKASRWSDGLKKLIQTNSIPITVVTSISAKKESTDPSYVRSQLMKFVNIKPDRSSNSHPKYTPISKSREKKIHEWYSNNQLKKNDVLLIEKFLKDMNVRGWY